MDVTAYKNLLDIILAGFSGTLTIKALLAFVFCLFFTYTALAKEGDEGATVIDILWVALPALFSFLLTSVVIFVLSTSLTYTNMTDLAFSSFTLSNAMAILTFLCFLGVAVWLFFSENKKSNTFEDDDDLPAASLISVIFGVGLSGFVFLGVEFPKELLAQAVSVEVIQQGVFYGFMYFFSFLLVWFLLLVVFHVSVGRFFLGRINKLIGSGVLVFAVLLQVFL